MQNLKNWLSDAGLGHLYETFRAANIDIDVICELSDSDLKELEIALGDRRRLLRAMGEIKQYWSPDGSIQTEPERRQVTVMFSDLVNYTSLSRSIDPEDLRECVRYYQGVCTRAVARYGGYVSRFVGDGILVVFGYPRACEDAAERAVRAALEIVDTIGGGDGAPRLNHDQSLAVRVGIATGQVIAGDIIGEGASEQKAIIGDTPNMAARLQNLADPNTIVVSSTTRQLLGSGVTYEYLGEADVKGVIEPTPVWKVLAVNDPTERFVDAYQDPDSILVGREHQLSILHSHWLQVYAGTGSVVLVEGEAGIGKSHLCANFLSRFGERMGCQEVFMHCSPHHKNSAFYPVIEQINHSAKITHLDDENSRATKIMRLVREWGVTNLDDWKPVIKMIAAYGQESFVDNIPADRLRRLIISLLVERIVIQSKRKPVLVLMEDAQWLDPSTNEYLSALAQATVDDRILIIITARTDELGGFPMGILSEEIVLDRLTAGDVRKLVTITAQKKGLEGVLDEKYVRAIVKRADGIPLYVEELTKSVLEDIQEYQAAARPAEPGLTIPLSLQGLLAVRLDRLGAAKRVAQLGAVLGRSFTFARLRSLWDESVEGLHQAIDTLVDAELLTIEDRSGRSLGYRFKHTLIRDAAYESLLTSKQRVLHRSVAKVLSAEADAGAPVRLELIAQHHSDAKDSEIAARCWLAACKDALRRHENNEAKAYIEFGLTNLYQLEEDENRHLLERELQIARGQVLISVEGHASTEVEMTFKRAITLTELLGDESRIFDSLWGLTAMHFMRADIAKHSVLSAKLIDIACAGHDHKQLLVAECSRTLNRFAVGEFAACREHLTNTLACYDPSRDAQLVHEHAVDRKVLALQFGSQACWMLGYTRTAVKLVDEMQQHASWLNHPYSMAQSFTSGANVYMLRREPEQLLKMAEKGIEIAERYDHPRCVDHGEIWIGWAMAIQGRGADGIQMIKRALKRFSSTGARQALPKFHALLAELLLQEGDFAQADTYLNNALLQIESTSERSHLSEVHRIWGMLHHKSGAADTTKIDREFAAARCVAKRQNALSFELSTALSRYDVYYDRGLDTLDCIRQIKSALEAMPEPDMAYDRKKATAILERHGPVGSSPSTA